MPDELLTHWTASEDELEPEAYPNLFTISPAMWWRFQPVPNREPVPPEYVWVQLDEERSWRRARGRKTLPDDLAIAQWNWAWESGPMRRLMFAKQFPRRLRRIVDSTVRDVRLVPRTRGCRYEGTTSLYHLLPRRALERHGHR